MLSFSIHFAFPALREMNRKTKQKISSWIIPLVLDILVCSIAEYFYSLFVLWFALQACQNKAQFVKNTQNF